MSLGHEIAENATIEESINYSCGQQRYGNVRYWKMKGGKFIAIRDMTDEHLNNTIKMLKRQIDGSIHDEFVYDNIIAMENELKHRRDSCQPQSELECISIPFKLGQVVYVIKKVEEYHYEEHDGGHDHLGLLPPEIVRVTDGYHNEVKELKFYYGLLDKYAVNEIYTTKSDAEKEIYKTMKIQNVDLKVVGVTFKNEDTGEKRADIIRELAHKKQNDIKVELVREPNNKYDMNAVKVFADSKQIGYIGKEYAQIIAPLMDEYEEFSAVVKGIGEYKNRPYCEITINQL